MAHAPPSYQAAAYRQFWIIVAPYVHSYDLYRACLVCRQWHQLFAPFLWGDPARKFGFDDDNIYCTLLDFHFDRVAVVRGCCVWLSLWFSS
ncbi:hypothetical protein BKA65DRAFT_498010 [Rhexocercosporidium sp. MPI-PUGE-AT-0058]|nr:hypothetical protein BKA65DRAFT_498010 [Rhexocercosporidium sp. MPI-PUGE-AT-0058]